MPDKKPTPIRKRASAKPTPIYPTATVAPGPRVVEPKPLTFPPPDRHITVTPSAPATIYDLTLAEIVEAVNMSEAQHKHVARLMARLIYKIAARVLEPDITEMGEAQFEAFCLSLMEDME
jgi:hypothetical protein